MSSPDLFVVCKTCRAEVSPYITECPYCGNRLRKRAPKLEPAGSRGAARKPRRRPSLPPLRAGEIPGLRAEGRPWVTMSLVVASLGVTIAWRAGLLGLGDVAVAGKPGHEWWRVLTAPLVYDNTGYGFVALGAIAVFGWLLERRHGPVAAAAIIVAGAAGGMAAAAGLQSLPIAAGGNGGALAALVAWVIPDLLDLRRGEDIEGDLIGVAVWAAALLALPVAVDSANWLVGATGVAAGLVLGAPLALLRSR